MIFSDKFNAALFFAPLFCLISAGESKHINLPYGKLPMEGETVLTCFLVLAEDKGLLPAGTLLSHGQMI